MKKQSLIFHQTLHNNQHMSLFSMQNIQPEYLTTYIAFIENYLRQQMFTYEQKYKGLEQNRKQILKNYDIEMYSLRTNHENNFQQDSQAEEEIRDDNLLRRIEQYNRIAKPNKSRDKDKNRRYRRNAEGEEGKTKRKVRTTITPAKLQEMNRIFKQYLQNQEKNRDGQDQEGLLSVQSDRQAEYGSLKLIGQRLGLGYSTILHKFREYRATRKVKGGALIASINHKRKYKKSREIEQLIQQSLTERTFYTAVELSRHIQTKYNKTLSRSIISRHLGQMGYSYKNIKTTIKPTNRNTNCIKQLRRNFSAAISMQREQSFAQVYYLDEIVLTYDEMSKKLNQSAENEEDTSIEVNLTLMATKQGLIKYTLSPSPIQQQEFLNYLKEIEQFLLQRDTKVTKIIMMDMQNPNHLCQKIIQTRKRMKQENIRIFYQPPHSNQLNLLEWFGMDLKRMLSGRSYSTFDSFREQIEETLVKYSMKSLENYFLDSQEYIKRSMIMQNF